MERKHRRMIEGQVCLFSLPRGLRKARVTHAIEDGLEASACGRVLGSGTSLFDDGTIIVEIASSDTRAADDVVSEVCRKLRCRDYEVIWD